MLPRESLPFSCAGLLLFYVHRPLMLWVGCILARNPRNPGFQNRVFLDFSTATKFRHGAHVAAGVPLLGSRSGPMGTKLAHVRLHTRPGDGEGEGVESPVCRDF